jgi:HEAT repeat protein
MRPTLRDALAARRRVRATLTLVASAMLSVASIGATACGGSDPGYGGVTSKDWIGRLADANPARRVEAADALGHVLAINPRVPGVVEALVRALGDTVDGVRLAAAGALTKEDVRAPDAVPGLAAALADSAHANVRAEAVRVLGTVLFRVVAVRPTRLGARAGEPPDTGVMARGVDALLGAVHDRDLRVRTAAVEALGALGPRAAAAASRVLPTLVELARAPAPGLRLAAIEALRKVGAPPSVLLPVVRPAVADSAVAVRLAAVDVLGALGPAAVAAVPELVRGLRDRDPAVRATAAVALGLVGPERAEGPLRAALADPDAAVRREAAHALDTFHRRGGQDTPPPEPSKAEKCLSAPVRTPGC